MTKDDKHTGATKLRKVLLDHSKTPFTPSIKVDYFADVTKPTFPSSTLSTVSPDCDILCATPAVEIEPTTTEPIISQLITTTGVERDASILKKIFPTISHLDRVLIPKQKELFPPFTGKTFSTTLFQGILTSMENDFLTLSTLAPVLPIVETPPRISPIEKTFHFSSLLKNRSSVFQPKKHLVNNIDITTHNDNVFSDSDMICATPAVEIETKPTDNLSNKSASHISETSIIMLEILASDSTSKRSKIMTTYDKETTDLKFPYSAISTAKTETNSTDLIFINKVNKTSINLVETSSLLTTEISTKKMKKDISSVTVKKAPKPKLEIKETIKQKDSLEVDDINLISDTKSSLYKMDDILKGRKSSTQKSFLEVVSFTKQAESDYTSSLDTGISKQEADHSFSNATISSTILRSSKMKSGTSTAKYEKSSVQRETSLTSDNTHKNRTTKDLSIKEIKSKKPSAGAIIEDSDMDHSGLHEIPKIIYEEISTPLIIFDDKKLAHEPEIMSKTKEKDVLNLIQTEEFIMPNTQFTFSTAASKNKQDMITKDFTILPKVTKLKDSQVTMDTSSTEQSSKALTFLDKLNEIFPDKLKPVSVMNYITSQRTATIKDPAINDAVSVSNVKKSLLNITDTHLLINDTTLSYKLDTSSSEKNISETISIEHANKTKSINEDTKSHSSIDIKTTSNVLTDLKFLSKSNVTEYSAMNYSTEIRKDVTPKVMKVRDKFTETPLKEMKAIDMAKSDNMSTGLKEKSKTMLKPKTNLTKYVPSEKDAELKINKIFSKDLKKTNELFETATTPLVNATLITEAPDITPSLTVFMSRDSQTTLNPLSIVSRKTRKPEIQMSTTSLSSNAQDRLPKDDAIQITASTKRSNISTIPHGSSSYATSIESEENGIAKNMSKIENGAMKIKTESDKRMQIKDNISAGLQTQTLHSVDIKLPSKSAHITNLAIKNFLTVHTVETISTRDKKKINMQYTKKPHIIHTTNMTMTDSDTLTTETTTSEKIRIQSKSFTGLTTQKRAAEKVTETIITAAKINHTKSTPIDMYEKTTKLKVKLTDRMTSGSPRAKNITTIKTTKKKDEISNITETPSKSPLSQKETLREIIPIDIKSRILPITKSALEIITKVIPTSKTTLITHLKSLPIIQSTKETTRDLMDNAMLSKVNHTKSSLTITPEKEIITDIFSDMKYSISIDNSRKIEPTTITTLNKTDTLIKPIIITEDEITEIERLAEDIEKGKNLTKKRENMHEVMTTHILHKPSISVLPNNEKKKEDTFVDTKLRIRNKTFKSTERKSIAILDSIEEIVTDSLQIDRTTPEIIIDTTISSFDGIPEQTTANLTPITTTAPEITMTKISSTASSTKEEISLIPMDITMKITKEKTTPVIDSKQKALTIDFKSIVLRTPQIPKTKALSKISHIKKETSLTNFIPITRIPKKLKNTTSNGIRKDLIPTNITSEIRQSRTDIDFTQEEKSFTDLILKNTTSEIADDKIRQTNLSREEKDLSKATTTGFSIPEIIKTKGEPIILPHITNGLIAIARMTPKTIFSDIKASKNTKIDVPVLLEKKTTKDHIVSTLKTSKVMPVKNISMSFHTDREVTKESITDATVAYSYTKSTSIKDSSKEESFKGIKIKDTMSRAAHTKIDTTVVSTKKNGPTSIKQEIMYTESFPMNLSTKAEIKSTKKATIEVTYPESIMTNGSKKKQLIPVTPTHSGHKSTKIVPPADKILESKHIEPKFTADSTHKEIATSQFFSTSILGVRPIKNTSITTSTKDEITKVTLRDAMPSLLPYNKNVPSAIDKSTAWTKVIPTKVKLFTKHLKNKPHTYITKEKPKPTVIPVDITIPEITYNKSDSITMIIQELTTEAMPSVTLTEDMLITHSPNSTISKKWFPTKFIRAKIPQTKISLTTLSSREITGRKKIIATHREKSKFPTTKSTSINQASEVQRLTGETGSEVTKIEKMPLTISTQEDLKPLKILTPKFNHIKLQSTPAMKINISTTDILPRDITKSKSIIMDLFSVYTTKERIESTKNMSFSALAKGKFTKIPTQNVTILGLTSTKGIPEKLNRSKPLTVNKTTSAVTWNKSLPITKSTQNKTIISQVDVTISGSTQTKSTSTLSPVFVPLPSIKEEERKDAIIDKTISIISHPQTILSTQTKTIEVVKAKENTTDITVKSVSFYELIKEKDIISSDKKTKTTHVKSKPIILSTKEVTPSIKKTSEILDPESIPITKDPTAVNILHAYKTMLDTKHLRIRPTSTPMKKATQKVVVTDITSKINGTTDLILPNKTIEITDIKNIFASVIKEEITKQVLQDSSSTEAIEGMKKKEANGTMSENPHKGMLIRLITTTKLIPGNETTTHIAPVNITTNATLVLIRPISGTIKKDVTPTHKEIEMTPSKSTPVITSTIKRFTLTKVIPTDEILSETSENKTMMFTDKIISKISQKENKSEFLKSEIRKDTKIPNITSSKIIKTETQIIPIDTTESPKKDLTTSYIIPLATLNLHLKKKPMNRLVTKEITTREKPTDKAVLKITELRDIISANITISNMSYITSNGIYIDSIPLTRSRKKEKTLLPKLKAFTKYVIATSTIMDNAVVYPDEEKETEIFTNKTISEMKYTKITPLIKSIKESTTDTLHMDAIIKIENITKQIIPTTIARLKSIISEGLNSTDIISTGIRTKDLLRRKYVSKSIEKQIPTQFAPSDKTASESLQTRSILKSEPKSVKNISEIIPVNETMHTKSLPLTVSRERVSTTIFPFHRIISNITQIKNTHATSFIKNDTIPTEKNISHIDATTELFSTDTDVSNMTHIKSMKTFPHEFIKMTPKNITSPLTTSTSKTFVKSLIKGVNITTILLMDKFTPESSKMKIKETTTNQLIPSADFMFSTPTLNTVFSNITILSQTEKKTAKLIQTNKTTTEGTESKIMPIISVKKEKSTAKLIAQNITSTTVHAKSISFIEMDGNTTAKSTYTKTFPTVLSKTEIQSSFTPDVMMETTKSKNTSIIISNIKTLKRMPINKIMKEEKSLTNVPTDMKTLEIINITDTIPSNITIANISHAVSNTTHVTSINNTESTKKETTTIIPSDMGLADNGMENKTKNKSVQEVFEKQTVQTTKALMKTFNSTTKKETATKVLLTDKVSKMHTSIPLMALITQRIETQPSNITTDKKILLTIFTKEKTTDIPIKDKISTLSSFTTQKKPLTKTSKITTSEKSDKQMPFLLGTEMITSTHHSIKTIEIDSKKPVTDLSLKSDPIQPTLTSKSHLHSFIFHIDKSLVSEKMSESTLPVIDWEIIPKKKELHVSTQSSISTLIQKLKTIDPYINQIDKEKGLNITLSPLKRVKDIGTIGLYNVSSNMTTPHTKKENMTYLIKSTNKLLTPYITNVIIDESTIPEEIPTKASLSISSKSSTTSFQSIEDTLSNQVSVLEKYSSTQTTKFTLSDFLNKSLISFKDIKYFSPKSIKTTMTSKTLVYHVTPTSSTNYSASIFKKHYSIPIKRILDITREKILQNEISTLPFSKTLLRDIYDSVKTQTSEKSIVSSIESLTPVTMTGTTITITFQNTSTKSQSPTTYTTSIPISSASTKRIISTSTSSSSSDIVTSHGERAGK